MVGPIRTWPTVTDMVTYASVCLAVAGFVTSMILERKQKTTDSLRSHFAKAAAAGSIPTALVLVYCAFKPSIIATLTGLNVPIAAAGLSLLYVSIISIFNDREAMESRAISKAPKSSSDHQVQQ